MKIVARELIDRERGAPHPTVEPRDAATLIIVDRSGAEPKVLLGRRHAKHAFLPGKYVFPGGGLDAADRLMPTARPLQVAVERKLLAGIAAEAAADVRALPLAAIRETFEEAGLVVGAKAPARNDIPSAPWAEFVATGFYPDPSALQFVARAITPPGYPRRFDARFFCADIAAVAHRIDDVAGSDAELIELIWLPIAETADLDLPIITRVVLEELESRAADGFAPDLPVPFYAMRDGEFTRETIV